MVSSVQFTLPPASAHSHSGRPGIDQTLGETALAPYPNRPIHGQRPRASFYDMRSRDIEAGIGKNRKCKTPLLVIGSATFLTGLMAVGGAFYVWYDPARQKDTDPKIALDLGVGGIASMAVGLGMAGTGMYKAI